MIMQHSIQVGQSGVFTKVHKLMSMSTNFQTGEIVVEIGSWIDESYLNMQPLLVRQIKFGPGQSTEITQVAQFSEETILRELVRSESQDEWATIFHNAILVNDDPVPSVDAQGPATRRKRPR